MIIEIHDESKIGALILALSHYEGEPGVGCWAFWVLYVFDFCFLFQ
mgnify:CR=1 FL=1